MPKERQGFILYHEDMLNACSELDDAQLGKLMRLLTDYSINGASDTSISDIAVRIYYKTFTSKISHDKAAYVEKCKKNKANSNKRFATDNDGHQSISTDNDGHQSKPTKQNKTKQNSTKQNISLAYAQRSDDLNGLYEDF